jgi:hypothetical protein
MNEQTHLARVEQVQRVDRTLDRLHELDGALAELVVQVLALPNPDTMLARAYRQDERQRTIAAAKCRIAQRPERSREQLK